MFPTSKLNGTLLTRTAMGVALALGGMSALAITATPALAAKKPATPAAPKMNWSKPFQTAAAPVSNAIEASRVRADVVAAKAQVAAADAALRAASTNAARAQGRTARDAAIAALGATLTPEKTLLETAFAVVTNPDDRYTAGQLAVNLGSLALDLPLQRRGIASMIDSGKVSAAELPKMQFFLGSLAYDAKDYAAARPALTAAVDAGYHDNDADALLADAYIQDNQAAQGLVMLQRAIDGAKSRGIAPPANWYRRGLGVAYKAKLNDQANGFSMGLVEAYPNTENWAGAITVLREIAHYPAQEELDLMRLMERTKSYTEERDYIEHIQSADPRRLPGEALRVVEAGLAAGKLKANDIFVAEAKSMSAARITADRASLPGLERDARAATAPVVTLMAAGDAFLSYGDAAKAEGFYNAALAKPGVDTARVLTRLGIAQFDLGKYADARATFANVTGPRKPMADLWAVYAKQKAAPPAAAPAA